MAGLLLLLLVLESTMSDLAPCPIRQLRLFQAAAIRARTRVRVGGRAGVGAGAVSAV